MVKDAVLCVIPARFGSTRLPGKPLIKVGGKPLVMWTYDRAVASGVFEKVCVATDDVRVLDEVVRYGGHAVMTSSAHASGTDRVLEAASAENYGFVVNLQGDEPLIAPDVLGMLADNARSLNDASLLTCVCRAAPEDKDNPNVVKVVINAQREALYFSRSPIPFDRDGTGGGLLKHCGIYAFTRNSLARFCALPRGVLEEREKLEQLRALEHGMSIKCLMCDYDGLSVDTPEDVALFRKLIER